MLKFKKETEFKETEIGKIPKDWEGEKIDSILLSLQKGKPPLKKYRYKGNYIYLSVKYLRGEEESLEFYSQRAGFIVHEDDILILWDGFNSGEIFRGKKGILASTMVKLKFKKNVDYDFMFWALKTREEEIKDAKYGTDDRHVDKTYFMNLQIPYPPPSEQSRIATVLSWFYDLIENKKRQNEILEKTAMAIFKSWFIDFEPFKNEEFVYNEELDKEIPKGWELGKLENIAKIENGNNAPQEERYFVNGRFPFVRVKHLSKGPCVKSCDFINENAIKYYKLKQFEEKSVVIQKSGESLKEARVNLLPFNSYVVNHLAIFDYKNNKLVIWFLFCYLKQILRDLIAAGESGTAIPYLKISDIKNFNILLPPQPILQKFHNLVEPLFKKIILNQKEIIVLRKIMDALLPQLVFGKLRVEEV